MRRLWRLLRDVWFGLRTLAFRGRFMTGKASLVEADIRSADTQFTEVLDSAGHPAGQKLISNYKLVTRCPRTGTQGWELFVAVYSGLNVHRTATLECGYCGHVYVISVIAEGDPLVSPQTQGRLLSTPASYTCDWFSYMHDHFKGNSTLSCVHCEQKGPPRIEFIT